MAVVLIVVAVAAAGGAAVAVAASSRHGRASEPGIHDEQRVPPGRRLRTAVRRRPRLHRFVSRRLDRTSAGGLLLTTSFLVVLAVSLVVGVLLDWIDDDEGLARVDASVATWGADHAPAALVDVARWVTHLGARPLVLAALALAALVEWRRDRRAGSFGFVAAVGLGEWAISNLLKHIVDRDRPMLLQHVGAGGQSFPSGHTTAAAATWAAVALVLARNRPARERRALTAAAVVVALAVGATRPILGVHWVTDVLAGLAVGWGWFALVAVAFGWRRQRLGAPLEHVVHDTVGTADAVEPDAAEADPVTADRHSTGRYDAAPPAHAEGSHR